MKISVIVPCYNVEAYLPQCLESILGQSYPELEVLCVDDGSSDGTLQVLAHYADVDSRVHVFSQENRGVSAARNLAISKAEGEGLMFVDGDDWLEPDTCACAVRAMCETGADVVMWTYVREFGAVSKVKHIFDGEELHFGQEDCRKLHRRMIGLVGEELRSLESADALCTLWGKLYRRALVAEHGVTVPDIRTFGTYEDGLFNLELFAYVRRAVFLNRPLYHYRRDNGGSITTAYQPELFRRQLRLFQHMEKYIQDHGCSEDYREALDNRVALSLISLGLNAEANPAGGRASYDEVRMILREPRCRAACRQLTLRYFPPHWKLFFLCAKQEWTPGVCLLLKCMAALRGK